MATIQEMTQEKLETGIKNTSSWFFWILGLSILNSVITYLKSDVDFLIGLTFTKILDIGMSQNSAPGSDLATILMLAANVVVFSFFLVVGIFSRRKNLALFIVGTLVYGLDSILSLVVQDYFSFGLHWFALFFLISGARFVAEAKRRIRLIENEPGSGSEITPVSKRTQTLIGTYASINYELDSNRLTPENSRISSGASLSIHLTIEGRLDLRNIYDKIDLSEGFSKDYLDSNGDLNISLKCKKVAGRILVNLTKYRDGKVLQEVEEEFELKAILPST